MALLVPPPIKRVAAGSKRKLQGVAFILVVTMLVALTILIYNKKLSPAVKVFAQVDRVGNLLQLGSDVKMRGLIVGEVRGVHTNGKTTVISMSLKPDKAKLIPNNVSARILPKTLFGPKYVDLIVPENPSPKSLKAGDDIPQDRTQVGIEVESVLNNALPVLRQVAPAKLNATLTALADALEGRGDELGDNLARLDDFLRQFNQHLDSFTTDLAELATVADNYNAAAPDLLRFLDNTSFTGRTIVEKQNTLAQFLQTVTTFADTGSADLTTDKSRLIQLAAISAPVTGELAYRSDDIPQIINGLTQLAPMEHAVFGGSQYGNTYWLHINLLIVPPKGTYKAPADCPKYVNQAGAMYGPNCGGGSSAQTAAGASDATPLPTDQASASNVAPSDVDPDLASIGPVGSDAEQQLIQRIVGAVTQAQAQTVDLSGMNDLLLGPMMRGAQVSVS